MSTHNNTEPEGEATYKSVVMAEKPIVPRKKRKIGGVGKSREKFNQQHLHSVSRPAVKKVTEFSRRRRLNYLLVDTSVGPG